MPTVQLVLSEPASVAVIVIPSLFSMDLYSVRCSLLDMEVCLAAKERFSCSDKEHVDILKTQAVQ